MPKKFKPIVEGTKLYVQGRISYQHLLEPAAIKDGDEKFYSCAVLVDKKDTDSIDAIRAAIKAATEEGKISKWKGIIPRNLKATLRDGEERDGEEFQGKMFFNCKSRRQPAVLNSNKAPILDPAQVYSGMWAIVCVNMFPYSVSGSNGVGVGLNAVLKTADDEEFTGADSGARSFDNIVIPDDDDDDDDEMI